MKKLEESGIEITALHNHLLRAEPMTLYMHVLGHGDPVKLASALIRPRAEQDAHGRCPPRRPRRPQIDLDTAAVRQAMGYKGKANNGIYQFSIPRAEPVKEDGMEVPERWVRRLRLTFSRPEEAKPRSPATSC